MLVLNSVVVFKFFLLSLSKDSYLQATTANSIHDRCIMHNRNRNAFLLGP